MDVHRRLKTPPLQSHAVPNPDDSSLRPGEAFVVAATVVVGVAFRFLTTSHLWLDEALSVDIARLPLGDIPDALRHDGHPPLYYFILHGWMRMFGESDVAVRSLSGIVAVLTVPLAWYAGRRIGGSRTGWAAAALLSLSPFAVRYATETRMYSLVMLLVFAGYVLVSHTLERVTWPRLAGIALVTGALLLLHYWALWLFAATVVVLVWRAWRARGDTRARTVRVLAAVLAGVAFLVPWLGVMLDQSAHTGTPWASPARPTSIIASSIHDFGGGDFSEGVILGWMLVGLFAIGLFARPIDDRRLEIDVRTLPLVRREASIVGLTFAIACVAGFASRTTFASRYAAMVFPLVVLVVAAGVTRFAGLTARSVVAVSVLLLGVVSSVHVIGTERTQAVVVADAINADAHPGDIVVNCPDQLGPALHRLLPDSSGLRQLSYPTLGDPSFVDWRDYAKRNDSFDPVAVADRIATMARSGQTVWLVSSGAYKTFDGDCEAVAGELAVALGSPSNPVVEDGDTYFEHEGLLRYPPASGRP